MSVVTLTAAMRNNLLALQNTALLMGSVQQHLSTGNKVNSALDSPTAFFAAQSLTSRANELHDLLDGMDKSIHTLKAADTGITDLTKLVAQAQAIANSAASAVTNTGGDVISGDIAAADAADLVSGTNTLFGDGDQFSLSIDGGVSSVGTVTIFDGETLQQLADSINALGTVSAKVISGSAGTAVGTVRLEITASSGNTLRLTNVTGTPAAVLAATLGVAGGITSLINGVAGVITSASDVAATGAASDYVTRQNDFNAVRTQIDALIQDTGYAGINLLNGDILKTIFNEKTGGAQNSQTITGVTFNSTGLGVGAANFTSTANIKISQDALNTALTTLHTQASSFGNQLGTIQIRQDFTINLVSILQEGSSNLTLADKNEEGANMLALQTSQQLGIQALAIASQANQSVLRLFA